jgi:hypothetical protein
VESDATVVVLCPPDLALASRERRVGELDRDGASAVDREVPPGGVAQVSLAVAVVAGRGVAALMPVLVPYA